MSGLEKIEVRPFTAQDRARIQSALGLDGFSFEYLETAGTQLVRHWIVTGNTIEPLFPTAGPIPEPTLPRLVRSHAHHQIAEVPLFPPTSLWSEWMAFPFCGLGELESRSDLKCSDPQWVQAAKETRAAIDALQKRLFQAEISMLTLPTEAGPIRVFSHAVRRRFLTLGIWEGPEADWVSGDGAPSLLAASFQALELSVARAPEFPAQAALLSQAVAALLARPLPGLPGAPPSVDSPLSSRPIPVS